MNRGKFLFLSLSLLLGSLTEVAAQTNGEGSQFLLNSPTNILNRYDFNGDGLISKEDVRIVLSYIPFKRDEVDT